MRLIDADKLESVDFSDCIDSMEIMNVIDAQPTAYDVDAVVKQLENLRHIDICDYVDCGLCPYTKVCNATSDQTDNLKFDKEIEIVKEGGVYELFN